MTPKIACQIVVRLLFGLIAFRLIGQVVSTFALSPGARVSQFGVDLLPVFGLMLLTAITIMFAAPLLSIGLPDQELDVSITVQEAMRIGIIVVGFLLVIDAVSGLSTVPHALAEGTFKAGNYLQAAVVSICGTGVIAGNRTLAMLTVPSAGLKGGNVG